MADDSADEKAHKQFLLMANTIEACLVKLEDTQQQLAAVTKERDELKREVERCNMENDGQWREILALRADVERLREVGASTTAILVRRRTALEAEGGRLHAFASIQVGEALQEIQTMREAALAAVEGTKGGAA